MPAYTTLITAAELQALQASGAPLLLFDCSFDLAQPEAGTQQYRTAHIPGAHYAHLDRDLSAAPQQPRASGGRHPLPLREVFADWLARHGLRRDMQVVVYDRNGANYCGRLWWMLKWLGHEAVAVLDGGLQAWQAADGAVRSGPEPAPGPTPFVPGPAIVALLLLFVSAQE
jgi:thiosulfate/3-mercaptopyruvate sulfurtransferase